MDRFGVGPCMSLLEQTLTKFGILLEWKTWGDVPSQYFRHFSFLKFEGSTQTTLSTIYILCLLLQQDMYHLFTPHFSYNLQVVFDWLYFLAYLSRSQHMHFFIYLYYMTNSWALFPPCPSHPHLLRHCTGTHPCECTSTKTSYVCSTANFSSEVSHCVCISTGLCFGSRFSIHLLQWGTVSEPFQVLGLDMGVFSPLNTLFLH